MPTTVTKSIGTATGSAGTGTVTAAASTAVVGVGTIFLTEMVDGSGFPVTMLVSGTLYNVTSITDDTHLTLTTSATFTAAAFTRGSRNYSLIQTWEDALPANLVTGDTVQIGECYNDSEFSVAGSLVTIAGETTDATHTITLQCGPGQSFRDNANAQTNALRYNQSNGVGLKGTGQYDRVLEVSTNFTTLVGLQIVHSGGNADTVNMSGSNETVRFCIIESVLSRVSLRVDQLAVTNCLLVSRGGTAIVSGGAATNWVCVNNTFVVPSDLTPGGDPVSGSYMTGTRSVVNCAMFGWGSIRSTNLSYTTCYTNVASPPSGCTTVAYDTSTGSGFQNITDATRDFRIKSGSAMLDVGTTDSTNAPIDIVKTTRPQGSAYDVGAWELVVAAASFTFFPFTQPDPAALLRKAEMLGY